MSDWRRRGTPSTGRDGAAPRPLPLLLAAAVTLLLLLDAFSSRAGIISAFKPESAKIDLILLEKKAIEATVQASEAQAGDPVAAPASGPAAPTAAPAASPPSVPNSACEPSGDDRFCLYTVQPGDTLAGIAARFQLEGATLPGWELLYESNKIELAGGEDLLVPGWVLRVPRSDAVLHLVLPGDSVSGLAVVYDVTTTAIATANGIADPDLVQIGDILLIPSPNRTPPLVLPEPAPLTAEDASSPDTNLETAASPGDDQPVAAATTTDATPESTPEATPEASETAEGEGTDATPESDAESPADAEGGEPGEQPTPTPATEDVGTQSGQDGNNNGADDAGEGDAEADASEGSEDESQDAEPDQPAPAAVADDATSMSWPVVQPVRITNYMTARHPLGIDLGLGGAPYSPITAAAGGTVDFAGGDPCCSYGYYVIIDHGNGLKTLYAHLSSIDVTKGEAVARGQKLGNSGATGNARGIHLHFEVYLGGKRVDPMRYLPQ